MTGMQVSLREGQEWESGWTKRGRGSDLKYLRLARGDFMPCTRENGVGNEIGVSRSAIPAGGISGGLHEGKTCQGDL